MDKKEIRNNNELIAMFMGGKFEYIKSHTPQITFKQHPNRSRNFNTASMHPKFLAYHKSWDWLMHVIDRIEDIGCVSVTIVDNECFINDIFIDIAIIKSKTKLQAVYEAVIIFIKWYNNEKSK